MSDVGAAIYKADACSWKRATRDQDVDLMQLRHNGMVKVQENPTHTSIARGFWTSKSLDASHVILKQHCWVSSRLPQMGSSAYLGCGKCRGFGTFAATSPVVGCNSCLKGQ
jgi:hypothetical protein